MDLSAFSLEDLLLSALKAETESRDFYKKLAAGVKNSLLKVWKSNVRKLQ